MTQNAFIDGILHRYENEIGSLRGQIIRTEAIMDQQIQLAKEQAQEANRKLADALTVLQEVASGLKNTNSQIQLRQKIEEFVAAFVPAPAPLLEAVE